MRHGTKMSPGFMMGAVACGLRSRAVADFARESRALRRARNTVSASLAFGIVASLAFIVAMVIS